MAKKYSNLQKPPLIMSVYGKGEMPSAEEFRQILDEGEFTEPEYRFAIKPNALLPEDYQWVDEESTSKKTSADWVVTLIVQEKEIEEMDAYSFWQIQLMILEFFKEHVVLMADHNSHLIFSAEKFLKLKEKSNPDLLIHLLYSVHSIYDEETGYLWLHTHGLARFTGFELELMGIKEIDNRLFLLFNVIATWAVLGYLREHTAFLLNNGQTIKLMKWQTALKYFDSKVVGGFRDRQDDLHRKTPSLILYLAKVKGKNELIGLDYLIPALQEDLWLK